MPFALELAVDPDSAAVVRTAWRALAAAGLGAAPLAARASAS